MKTAACPCLLGAENGLIEAAAKAELRLRDLWETGDRYVAQSSPGIYRLKFVRKAYAKFILSQGMEVHVQT